MATTPHAIPRRSRLPLLATILTLATLAVLAGFFTSAATPSSPSAPSATAPPPTHGSEPLPAQRIPDHGSLQITVLTAGGQPLPDRRILLCPPRTIGRHGLSPRRWITDPDAARWLRTTDAHGRVRFDHLPPNPGYRFFHTNNLGFALTPPHEYEAPVQPGSSRVSLRRAPLGVSGPFEIRVGETLRLEIRQRPHGAIRGIVIPRTTLLAPADLRLYEHITYPRPDSATPLQRWKKIFQGRTDRAGTFAIPNAPAGRLRLAVRWRETRDDWHLAARHLQLEAHDTVDLGAIDSGTGAPLTYSIFARESPATPVPVPASTLATLALSTRFVANQERGWFWERLPSRPNTPQRIFGLMAGPISLRGELHPATWPTSTGSVTATASLRRIHTTVPRTAPLRIPIPVTRRDEQRLELLFPQPITGSVEYAIHPTSSTDPVYENTLGLPSAPARHHTITVPRPEAAATICLTATTPHASYFGRVLLTRTPSPIPMAKGWPARGTVVDSAGTPRPNTALYLGWADVSDSPLWKTTTDDDGRFTLPGLPPHARLVCIGPRRSHVRSTPCTGQTLELLVTIAD